MKNKRISPRWAFFFRKNALSDARQSKSKKILSSIAAIFCSLVIAIIIACTICKAWPKLGNVIATMFGSGFKSTNINSMLSLMSIMLVSGLSFIFAYKAGQFNIGISGQMVMGGTIATIVTHTCHLPTGASQFVCLIVSIMAASLVAALVGVLKAFFNVNEVVSSIMLNWIIYYFSILILSSLTGKGIIKTDSSSLNTAAPDNSLLLRIGSGSYIPLLIIAFFVLVFVIVILNYTVFGKKQKVIGLSRTGALAAGYNVKSNIILALTISGAIAGILGVMNYCGYNPQMPVTAAAKAIPQEGFNGISVGLIAMCSPAASIPVSLFFAMIQTSVAPLSNCGIDNHIAQLIFGIVVYGAAAISLFLNLKPYWFTLSLIKGKNYSKIKHEENMAEIALIDLASDHNAALKKFYTYYNKKQKIKSTFSLNFSWKVKMAWANIRYKLLVFWYGKVRNFDSKKIKKVKVYAKLKNSRDGLYYRTSIADANILNLKEWESIECIAKSNGLPYIKDREQYRYALEVYYRTYLIVLIEIKSFYAKVKADYELSRQQDKNFKLDLEKIKYDPNKIEESYMGHLRAGIARNKNKIAKEVVMKSTSVQVETKWEAD